jgi:hypothetical protein
MLSTWAIGDHGLIDNPNLEIMAAHGCKVGLAFPHRQMKRREWRIPQQKPTEELIDCPYLEEQEQGLPDSYTWRVEKKV